MSGLPVAAPVELHIVPEVDNVERPLVMEVKQVINVVVRALRGLNVVHVHLALVRLVYYGTPIFLLQFGFN